MSPRFDLIDIVQTLHQRIKYILIISVAAALLGAIIFLVRDKKYKATSTFFVSNPKYIDRDNLFHNEHAQPLDYFGSEDDMDKIVAIANSDSLARNIVIEQNLGPAYGLDPSKPAEMARLINSFHGTFEAKRTENSTMDINFIDGDPKRAADVANAVTQAISTIYSNYFTNLRAHIAVSLQQKVFEADSTIAKMTDTLAALRDRYGIYDIISPSRKNIISGSLHSTGPGFGHAMEDIQTIESIKDRMVIDRAEYLSLINEFNTSRSANLPLIQVLNKAYPPYKTKDFGLAVTVLIAFAVALFCSSLWVLLEAYFRTILTTERS